MLCTLAGAIHEGICCLSVRAFAGSWLLLIGFGPSINGEQQVGMPSDAGYSITGTRCETQEKEP